MNHWAVIIGINHYRHFQPLSFAQRDAQVMHRFLIEEGGFAPERCLLLTDTSPAAMGRSTYPSRETIEDWLECLGQGYLQPGDALWLFFSGYGTCQQGMDYLIPIEAEPGAIAQMAIPLTDLYQRLQTLPTQNILILLDMNRSQGIISRELVGAQALEIAAQTGIATILGCKPEQFSRESITLGQGFFTAALVESLRSPGVTTLDKLEQHLSVRLPELSEQYWRPTQQAVVVSPPEKRYQILLPRQVMGKGLSLQPPASQPRSQSSSQASSSPSMSRFAPSTPSPPQPVAVPLALTAKPGGIPAATNGKSSVPSPYPADSADRISNGVRQAGDRQPVSHGAAVASHHSSPRLSHLPDGSTSQTTSQEATLTAPQPLAPPKISVTAPEPSARPEPSQTTADDRFWNWFLVFGGIATALMLAGVLWQQRNVFFPIPPSAPTTPAQPGSATGDKAISQNQSVSEPKQDSEKPEEPTDNASSKLPPEPKLNGMPPGDPPPLAKAETHQDEAARTSLQDSAKATSTVSLSALLAIARTNIKSEMATPYWNAIQAAAQIPQNHPEYAQAQQEMANWSREIWAIAQRRSQQGEVSAAIWAASLVPPTQASVYPEIRPALNQWCRVLATRPNESGLSATKAKEICQALPKS